MALGEGSALRNPQPHCAGTPRPLPRPAGGTGIRHRGPGAAQCTLNARCTLHAARCTLHAALLRDNITAEEGDTIFGDMVMRFLGSGRRDTELEVKVLHRGRRGQGGERNVYTFD